MSELQFYCPSCNQKVMCDERWSGQQVQCPSCQVMLIVPDAQPAPAAPAPPPAAPTRITHPTAPAPAPAPVMSAPRITHRPAKAKSGNPAKAIKICVVLVVVAVGAYFGITFGRTWQAKYNENSRKAEANSDGGQLGHIAELNSVLDATDPNNFSRKGPRAAGADADDDDEPMQTRRTRSATTKTNTAPELPIIPAVWTLDLQTAKIPEGRANGMIHGSNFVAQAARVDQVGQAHVLALRQGSGLSGDREILIYLRLNPGETLAGHTWEISSDMKGTKVPQVMKRWKTDPRFKPLQKAFAAGYAMKLELGPLTDETITGKIFVALPDNEKSVVAGIFTLNMEPPSMPMRIPGGGESFTDF